jgi:hypothetical protein
MSRHATLFMEAETEPFSTSSGYINAALAGELRAHGYALDAHHHHRLGRADGNIPLATAGRLLNILGAPTADLAVFCDVGLYIRPPHRELARRSWVLFHGLWGAPSTWLANPDVDLYCVLSEYMHQVIGSLLALPDWRQRRGLDLDALPRRAHLVAPLPCVEEPQGHPLFTGAELPGHVLRALEAGDVVGHAIQPGKPDWLAVLSILMHLNVLAREHGGRRFRLVVPQEDYGWMEYSLMRGFPMDMSMLREALEGLELKLEDLLLPVPKLSHRALFSLQRQARFGLAYNTFPEPFGFYVLESVFNGCPVYTNGVGNNRHSLPPDHGIIVHQDAEMAFGNGLAYMAVAQRIFDDAARPEGMRAACARGRDYISRTYTRAAFSSSVKAALERMEPGKAAGGDTFDSLRVDWSPLVRLVEEETGRVVTDYEPVILSPDELKLLGEVRGRRAGELGREGEVGMLQSLFSRGVLSLVP